jgi:hypothetical protein
VEGGATAAGNLLYGTASLVNNTAGALEYALTSSFAPDWAYNTFGGYAQNFANTVMGTSQLVNNVAATATYGAISPFAPDYAYNNLGGNLQQLLGQTPSFYGGNNQSLAYKISYGTVNAATLFLGGEAGEVGNLERIAADTTLTQIYRVGAETSRSEILQLNRNLYKKFIESGGTFNSMRDISAINPDTANSILGTYNSVENSINLYRGSNLGTISEELIHWSQVQRAGLVGEGIPRAMVPVFEQNALTTLLQWGYKPQ